MSILKNKEEIEILREGGRRLARILAKIKSASKPGISTKDLDDLAFRLADEGGDKPAFLNYCPEENGRPYPATLCVSVNEELVHGLPSPEKILKDGDIISVDMGLNHLGLITDSAITFPIGKIQKETQLLLKATRECLETGIKEAKSGNFVGDIGFAIEKTAKKYGFDLAKGLAGHGVGHKVHEDPLIPNTGRRGNGMKIKIGMVLAIEPMLCLGSGEISLEKDGFTISTKDKSLCAHFEHTIAITEKGPEVLTC